MSIDNFPAILQPIIQQGYLDKEFLTALRINSALRMCARKATFACTIGKAAKWSHEDETSIVPINHYASTADLNLVTSRVGIALEFLQNAYVNGEQAARSMGEVAIHALWEGFAIDKSATFYVNRRDGKHSLTSTDQLTMSAILDAVAHLKTRGAPLIDGFYNCYLDHVSERQLFGDPDFKQLFLGATSANQIFRVGMTNDFLGVRFMPLGQHMLRPEPMVSFMMRNVIVCGDGALIEGNFAGIDADDVRPKNAEVAVIEGVAMVTHETADSSQPIVSQGWYWIGGYGAAIHKSGELRRAVRVRHAG